MICCEEDERGKSAYPLRLGAVKVELLHEPRRRLTSYDRTSHFIYLKTSTEESRLLLRRRSGPEHWDSASRRQGKVQRQETASTESLHIQD